ncbi:hypothetical protein [Pseudomonas fragi]|uniref:Uncharacterized protein n=1 Tax=Pseudomonas fragi TaxID=296 RepID=A0A9Q5B4M0_PSEFR|nr:hypothetical protein [Pseudomonas fragi]NNB27655.1 hypothetical protein [Pseudomonas fragi]NNB37109.1 hypothetical protein [Pseudomonas fragi]NNB52214.1 hypothetical protein [Pseudomonas fragi]
MFTKMPLDMPLGVLTMRETLSRLVKLDSSKLSKEYRRAGSFLTPSEVKSLRVEMTRDGALMKKWLATRDSEMH